MKLFESRIAKMEKRLDAAMVRHANELPWGCADCDTDTRSEYYSVRDRVWSDAGMKDGFLCIGCLERRLGRRLRKADFIDVPINKLSYVHLGHRKTRRLVERLTA